MGSFEWMEVEALSGEIAALETRLNAARSRHNYGLVKVLKEEIATAQQRRARYLANISNSLAASLDNAPQPEAKGAKAAPEPEAAPRGRKEMAEPEPVAPSEEVAEEAADAVPEAVEAAVEPEVPVDEPVAEPEAEPLEAVEVLEPVSEAAPEPEAPEVETAAKPTRRGAKEAEPPRAESEPEPEAIAPAEPEAAATEEPEVAAEPEPVAVEEAAAMVSEEATSSQAASAVADASKGVAAVWEQLSPTDIERAKRELDMRRAEMLARHAEELKALEADQVEIDTLAAAIDAFVRKFNQSATEGSVVRLDEKRAQGNG